MPAKVPDSDSIHVLKLERPSTNPPKKSGRRPKLAFPAIPEEILDGMTPIEREHFDFFIEAHQRQYPDLTPTDQIALHMAAFDYVNLLRLNADQMRTGQLVSMARQHPGVQLRAWMDSLSVTRKQRPAKAKDEDETLEFLKRMSS